MDPQAIAGWDRPLTVAPAFQSVSRDPFGLNPRGHAGGSPGLDASSADLPPQLGAIVSSGAGAVARIDNAFARVGDQVGRFTVVDITLDQVVLESPTETRVLRLAN
jgi:hypothetical protein